MRKTRHITLVVFLALVAAVTIGVSGIISFQKFEAASETSPTKYMTNHIESHKEGWNNRLAKDVLNLDDSLDTEQLRTWLNESAKWEVRGEMKDQSLYPYLICVGISARSEGFLNDDERRTIVIANYVAYVDDSGNEPELFSVQPDGKRTLLQRDFGNNLGNILGCDSINETC